MRRWVCLGEPAHAGAHRLDEHGNSVESDRIYVAMPLCWFLGDEGEQVRGSWRTECVRWAEIGARGWNGSLRREQHLHLLVAKDELRRNTLLYRHGA